MKGYWNHPEETKEAFFGEWFRTGDLGTEDDDGYFCIVDRKKDMIIVNGMNVYPRIVEEILYQHPAVREAAVVGEPDELHGEIPVASVALKEGAGDRAGRAPALPRQPRPARGAAQGPSDSAAAEKRGGQGPETRIAEIRRIRARHRQPRGVRKTAHTRHIIEHRSV
jgi:acyl-CoA synthetase (AMP-forming)/AMP-acid ligase II